MKRIFKGSIVGVLLFVLAQATAQVASAPSSASRTPGGFYAASYAFGVNPNVPALKLISANTSTGTQTYQLSKGAFALADGRVIYPFQVGNTVSVGVGSNAENVTLTAVSNCNSVVDFALTCSITGSFSNAHSIGEPVTSATYGLQEAIFDAFQSGIGTNAGGGTVVIDQYWIQLGGSSSQSATAGLQVSFNGASVTILPFSSVVIRDDRYTSSQGVQYFADRPISWTALASGSAPTVATGGTGSMSAGTHRVKYVYVDINGQLGQPSAETSNGSSLTALLITAPAASTGAVGWIPYVTAAAGGTKTEIMVPLAAANCTLTKLESIIPACAVTNATYGQTGSNALVTADPSGTPKIFGNASLTFANDTGYQGSSTTNGYVPVPANTAYFQFSPVIINQATASGNASTYEAAMFNLPTNFFNVLGKRYRFCANGHVTSAANSQTLTTNLRFGPYQNSDTVLNALVTTAYSSTNVADFKACVELATTVLGATGTIVTDHGWLITNLAGSAAITHFTEATASNTNTGVVASLPLNAQEQLTWENVVGTGNFGGALTWDSIAIEPLN